MKELEKDEHGLYIYASNYKECKTEIENIFTKNIAN